MRRDRDESGEGEKTKRIWSGSRTHCRLVLKWLRSSHSRCHAMVLDIFGKRPDAPPPPGERRWLLRSRAAGSQFPVPCSSPNMADCSETSIPPVLLLLQHHRLGQPLAVSASSCCPTSSAPRSPSAADSGQWQSSLTVCPSFLPGFGTIVMQFVDREKGGEDLQTLIIKWTNTKEKLQPLADDCHTHKTQNVSPGLFLSPLPLSSLLLLSFCSSSVGLEWVVQMSLIIF